MAAAPWIAAKWIKASTLSTRSIRQALMIMGLLAALQWPVGLLSRRTHGAEAAGAF